jgi:SpoIID/LytB domain protein
VTARGEIFSKLGQRHFGEPYHLCSEQHCQVYAGAGFERLETNRAVDETRGLLAVRPRQQEGESLRLVDSVYSSSCGGFSGANEDVWGNSPSESLRPKLDGRDEDPAFVPFKGGLDEKNLRNWLESYPPTECARSSFARPEKFRWKKTIGGAELERVIAPLAIGRLKDVHVLGREPGGRVTGLRLQGTERSTDVLRELPVRRLFRNLNSGMFVFDLARDKKGLITSISFTGGGWGHGVGMCQVGAIGRAERKEDFRQILGHYYNGAVVERLY